MKRRNFITTALAAIAALFMPTKAQAAAPAYSVAMIYRDGQWLTYDPITERPYEIVKTKDGIVILNVNGKGGFDVDKVNDEFQEALLTQSNRVS